MVEKFTQNSDVKLIVEEKQIMPSQFKRFLGRKGIFSLVRNAEELSNQIYPFFFGSDDITYIQQLMQTTANYKKSSIITLIPKNKEILSENFIDSINEEIQNYKIKNEKYKVENIYKDNEGNLHFKMIYAKKVKGNIELIKDKIKEVGVKISKTNDDTNKLIIDIRQNDTSDLKEFDLFISQINIAEDDLKLFDIEYITLDKLTKENKIKFYDKIIAHKYNGWKFIDVKSVSVCKGEDLEKEELDNDDDEEDGSSDVISVDELAGIRTAVLQGNSIRDSGIVKRFEKENFYFTSMSLKYLIQSTLEAFIIDINFKGTNNIKIDIIKTYGEDEKGNEILAILPSRQQEEIILKFQKEVCNIYESLL
ncbi:hypothetical protein CDLVIII_0179 [Clostridium sp. DL-VIII]|uniref:hypothetical protein n=1 Tax=Clostridium sp. DL-VIII TaxID=641107 RepID=UPI00023AF897|nr:hypothetical protein [Clostridium sp. DL-VIII]EHI96917.1 hypothetical protein CDLVIII_0179 [Clostridium sp. DL-VIII]